MAYSTPTKFTRGYDFSSYQTSNPADPLPASSVDSQLDNIATHYNKTVDNLVVIQRSDGKLANNAVHIQTFDTAALALIGNNFTPKGDWGATTTYAANDMVEQSGNVYIALEAHTSSAAFSTDDAKWQIIANSSISTDAATVENFTGTGSTSVFTTSVTYQSANNAQVFVNGALVRPTTDYTLSGTTLTFTAGYGHPPSAATILIWGVSSTVASITTSVNSASASATAAAASLATFQGQYHGAASSDPSSGLNTGDLYFNTSDNIMKTYNGSAWVRIQPTSADQAHINTVSGINANVTSVAGKATEIGRLGTTDAIADLALLGTADAVADMNTLAVADVIADMNTLAVADVISDMNTLATADIVSDMNTLAVADVISDMNTLATAANVTAMDTLGTSANVTNMATNATNIANINTVAADATDIGAVAGKVTEIGRLGTADAVADMNTLGTSAIVSDMDTCATNASSITSTAGAIANVNTVATNLTNINTTATNIADVNAFSEIYRISSSAPSTSLDEGDLWWDSTNDALKVRTSSAWYDPVGTASTHATNAASSATSAASHATTFSGLGHYADYGDLTAAGSPTDYGALT